MNKKTKKTKIDLKMLESLEDLLSICKKLNCQFRIFGSLIYAAVKGNFYRKIGDIDCFIDNRFKEKITNELEKRGYKSFLQKDEDIPSLLFFLGFRTENFIKDDIKLSLFYVSFDKKYMEIPLRFGLSFRVPYGLIDKNYKFYGKEFKGLIPEAALFVLPLVKDKTKRKKDIDALLPFCNPGIIQKIRDVDTFFWFGKRAPLISAILASRIDKILFESQKISK